MKTTRLAVLGSPIAHSLSPTLHRTAYDVLGLDWSYESIELTGADLGDFLRSRDSSWRGLSLTMPLKRDILPLLDSVSALASQAGSANTVLFEGGQRFGFNTDVYGITEAFARHGVSRLSTVLILGGGATAASALVAVRELGVRRVFLGVRSPERASGLVELARAQGIELLVRGLDALVQIDEPLDAVISTLPNGAEVGIELDPDVLSAATLFDVAYAPWPTPLAATWTGERVISGLEMLVMQALGQVRIFALGDPHGHVDREPDVLAAMLASVDL